MQEVYQKIFNYLAGADFSTLVSGFFGGVVYVAFTKNLTRLQMFTSVLIGLLTAYYITPIAVLILTNWFSLHLSPEIINGIAFLLGLFALFLIPAVIRKLSKVGA